MNSAANCWPDNIYCTRRHKKFGYFMEQKSYAGVNIYARGCNTILNSS